MNNIITEKLMNRLKDLCIEGNKLFVRDMSTSTDYHIGVVAEKDLEVPLTIKVGMEWDDYVQTYKVVDIVDGYAIITRRWSGKIDDFEVSYEKLDSLRERLPKVTQRCMVWSSMDE